MKRAILLLWIIGISALQAWAAMSVRIDGGVPEAQVRLQMEAQTAAFLSEINISFIYNTQPNLSSLQLSQTLQDHVRSLWNYTRFRAMDHALVCHGLTTYNGYQIRDIRLEFAHSDGTSEYQEGIINFDNQGHIVSFRLALNKHLVGEILYAQDSLMDLRRRKLILDYMEQFRTAYNQKDLYFLNQVYSDDALIIVGQVIQTTKDEIKAKDCVYVTRTKQEYLKRLTEVFSKNKRINVTFKRMKVLVHPAKADYYGVLVQQGYTSDMYSDEGYLFLFWDFRDEQHPMIHIRRWEPNDSFFVEMGKEEKALDNFISNIRFH